MKFHSSEPLRLLPFRLGSRERDDLTAHLGGELDSQMAQSTNSNDTDAMRGSEAVECHRYSELATNQREKRGLLTSKNGDTAAHEGCCRGGIEFVGDEEESVLVPYDVTSKRALIGVVPDELSSIVTEEIHS
jgi:hypothetical protein